VGTRSRDSASDRVGRPLDRGGCAGARLLARRGEGALPPREATAQVGARRARARSSGPAGAGGAVSDVLALLRAADPVREAELPAPDAALRERILRMEVAPAKPIRRRVVLMALAATAAVAAAAILPRALEREPAAAAAVLHRAAAAASAAPAPSGRYAYTEATTITSATDTDDPPFTALIPAVQETWIAADGSGQIRTVNGTPYFPSERDRSRWLAHGSPPLGQRPGSVTVERLRVRPDAAALAQRDPATLDARELDALLNAPAFLPTDTDRLERVLEEYAKTKDPPAERMIFNQL